jgi:hypothetical protein
MTNIQQVLERYDIPRAMMAYPCGMSAKNIIRFSTDGWTFGKVVSIPQQKRRDGAPNAETHLYGFANQVGCLCGDDGDVIEPMRNIWFKSSTQIRSPLRIGPVVFNDQKAGGAFPHIGSTIVGKILPNAKRTGYKYEWWCDNGRELLWFLRYKEGTTKQPPLQTPNLWILSQVIYHNDVDILVDQYLPSNRSGLLSCNRMRGQTNPHAFALELSKMCNRPRLFECFRQACDARIATHPEIIQSSMYPNEEELVTIYDEHTLTRQNTKVDRCFVG